MRITLLSIRRQASAKRAQDDVHLDSEAAERTERGGSDLSTVPPTHPADVDPVGYGYFVASTSALADVISMTLANPMPRPWALGPDRWSRKLCGRLVMFGCDSSEIRMIE
jgi:hypothetical protein